MNAFIHLTRAVWPTSIVWFLRSGRFPCLQIIHLEFYLLLVPTPESRSQTKLGHENTNTRIPMKHHNIPAQPKCVDASINPVGIFYWFRANLKKMQIAVGKIPISLRMSQCQTVLKMSGKRESGFENYQWATLKHPDISVVSAVTLRWACFPGYMQMHFYIHRRESVHPECLCW